MEICVINKEHYGCFNACIASVAKTWKMDYSLMFTSSWGFQYVKQKNDHFEWLGNRFGAGWHSPFSLYLKEFHGLLVIINKESNIDEILKKVKHEIFFEYPVALFSDSFVCPWHKGFGKYHAHACFFVINVDENKGLFYCIDPSWSSNVEKLPFVEYEKAISKMVFFKKNEHIKKLKDLPNPIVDAAASFINSEAISSMQCFTEELQKYNYYEEFNAFQIEAVPILNSLKIIEDSRVNISEAFSYYFNIQKQADKFLFENRFLELAEEWSNLRKLMIKIGITHRTKDLSRAVDELNKLIKKEELLATEMMEFSK